MGKLAALAAGVTAALAMTGSTPAQTGDAQLDGTRHPNVGALLAKRTDGSLGIICSGTLVSPRVFLTAGHCADFMFSLGQFDAFVTFDPNFGTDPLHNIFSTPFQGALVQNPGFHVPAQNDTAQSYSGTCFGDSGGPTFVGAADGPVVISVVSSGDNPCYTLSVDERLDIANAQHFLAPYLALP